MIFSLKVTFLQSLKCLNPGDGQSTSVKMIKLFTAVTDQFPNCSPIKSIIITPRKRVEAVKKAAEQDPEKLMRHRSNHG